MSYHPVLQKKYMALLRHQLGYILPIVLNQSIAYNHRPANIKIFVKIDWQIFLYVLL